jgi:hypothetical protein
MGLRSDFGKPIPVSRAAEAPAAATLLSVPYRHQEQTNWCWAGCCEMVFLYYNINNVRQCDMASFQFGADCCAAPSSSICNQGNWPENIYPHWGVSCSRSNGSFSLSSVQFEINNDRPVEPYYAWTGGGAHVAIIRGYYDNGDLEVHDPWYGSNRHTFNDVVAAYGLGAWSITYHNLKR